MILQDSLGPFDHLDSYGDVMKKQAASESSVLQIAKSCRIHRASYAEMNSVADFIRSSKEWYRELVCSKDFKEHELDDSWIDRNFFRREFYIGSIDHQSFGSISIQRFGDWLYLGYIYLDVKFVGRGLGGELMKFACKQARERRCKGMVLIVHPKATWAIKAYEKFGFQCIATRRQEVLAWQGGVLQPYYEQEFHLYQYADIS